MENARLDTPTDDHVSTETARLDTSADDHVARMISSVDERTTRATPRWVRASRGKSAADVRRLNAQFDSKCDDEDDTF